jgi:hypothetical protein
MQTVEQFISTKYSKNPLARNYYATLWESYAKSGLADRHFVKELTSGDEGKFWQRAWEMLLHDHLARLGHVLYSNNEGPDFALQSGHTTVWVEAVVPSPVGVPNEWLELPRPRFGGREVPHEEMLLRWTSALKDKRDRLEGRAQGTRGYRDKGIVQNCDPYVVAINACRLSSLGQDKGASGLPLAVEAVFPVGPWLLPILEDEGRLGEPFRSVRLFLRKGRQANVPVGDFLDPAYAGVSALLGCSTCYAPDGALEIVVVHNPLAHNPLPFGILGATAEYRVEEKSDGYEVRSVGP